MCRNYTKLMLTRGAVEYGGIFEPNHFVRPDVHL